MTGNEANAAFTRARQLVSEGRYDEARQVQLIPSDRGVIEKRILDDIAKRAPA
jgi:hypothetical protein